MKPLRTALVGCGKIGRIHAAVLRSLPESDFVAACDADRSRAADLAPQAFTDVAELLSSARPDVVVIATPHPLHAEPAILAARAGVHVLVEKPLAATLADCDRMLSAAREAGVTLGVVSQRRFSDPARRVKVAIEAGKIGQPVLGVFQMYSWRDTNYYASDPWRGKWDTEGGGVLVNQSPHQLDLLRWYLGDVSEVCGYWANVSHPGVEVEDTAVVSLRFCSGALGSIVTSVSQKPGLYTKVHVHGSNGASVGVETDRGATFIAGMTAIAEPALNDVWTIPGEEGLLAEFQNADRVSFGKTDPVTHRHAQQTSDFLRAVMEKRPPSVSGEDGRAVVALFTAIYRAGREGRVVRLDEFAATHQPR